MREEHRLAHECGICMYGGHGWRPWRPWRVGEQGDVNEKGHELQRSVWEGTWVARHMGHGSSGRTEAQEEGVVFSWGGL